MNIEIITSRNAKLKETGFGSLLACDDVLVSLETMGHSVLVTVCETLEDLESVVSRTPDLVVLAAKYMPIEGHDNIWFSEYFEQNHITFSGSNRETLKYDSDKVSAKQRLKSLGIKTANYFTAIPGEYSHNEQLPIAFPLFLKPMDAANGNGIDDRSFVKNFSEFSEKVSSLYEIYKQPVLVEEYLSGKEFTVAITKSSSGKTTISAIEIAPPESTGGLKILGATAKLNDTETLKRIERHDIDSVNELAAASFKGLGARGFGRIDVKMDDFGVCYFMEANLVPGMNHGTSYFPQACEIENEISYDDVIKLILNESLQRASVGMGINHKLKTKLAGQVSHSLNQN
ncbi:MAG: hypothetical protein ACRBB4_00415 [Neptuniibacter sp.]